MLTVISYWMLLLLSHQITQTATDDHADVVDVDDNTADFVVDVMTLVMMLGCCCSTDVVCWSQLPCCHNSRLTQTSTGVNGWTSWVYQ